MHEGLASCGVGRILFSTKVFGPMNAAASWLDSYNEGTALLGAKENKSTIRRF